MSKIKHRRIIFLSTGLAILAALIGSATKAIAVPGAPDSTFGRSGKVTTTLRSDYDAGFSAALQADGKIVVAGRSNRGTQPDFAVARYKSNGALDVTFGIGGWVTTPIGFSSIALSVAIQLDGKIVVAGFTEGIVEGQDFAVVRYNPDGSLDTSFDGDGKVVTPLGRSLETVVSVKIQSDGKIVAAGYSINGGLNIGVFVVVRYNPDGSPDITFDGDGVVSTHISSYVDIAYSVAIQSDGKIVVGGESQNPGIVSDLAVVRYNSDGSLDTTFGNGGIVLTPIRGYDRDLLLTEIAIQSDGKIVGTGRGISSSMPTLLKGDFIVVRYNPNGTLDTSFGRSGIVTTAISNGYDDAQSMAIQPNGKIIIVGSSKSSSGDPADFCAVRYNPNGSLDLSFGKDGVSLTSFSENARDEAYSVMIQPDGKIILAGFSNYGIIRLALVRYLGDKRPPSDFNGDGKTRL